MEREARPAEQVAKAVGRVVTLILVCPGTAPVYLVVLVDSEGRRSTRPARLGPQAGTEYPRQTNLSTEPPPVERQAVERTAAAAVVAIATMDAVEPVGPEA